MNLSGEVRVLNPEPEREASNRSGWVRGEITWYHPTLAGGIMRDGETVYEPTMSGVVAAVSWPLGAVLEVRGPTRRALTVVVSDTGYLGEKHLDMSEADFIVLAGSLGPGRVVVSIREEP